MVACMQSLLRLYELIMKLRLLERALDSLIDFERADRLYFYCMIPIAAISTFTYNLDRV
jgi:hypothetical protein